MEVARILVDEAQRDRPGTGIVARQKHANRPVEHVQRFMPDRNFLGITHLGPPILRPNSENFPTISSILP